jgi:hypothetical protein
VPAGVGVATAAHEVEEPGDRSPPGGQRVGPPDGQSDDLGRGQRPPLQRRDGPGRRDPGEGGRHRDVDLARRHALRDHPERDGGGASVHGPLGAGQTRFVGELIRSAHREPRSSLPGVRLTRAIFTYVRCRRKDGRMCVSRIAWPREDCRGGPTVSCPACEWVASGPGLETARHPDGGLLVRAVGDTEGPVLHYTRAEVDAFVRGVRDGEFDDLAETD